MPEVAIVPSEEAITRKKAEEKIISVPKRVPKIIIPERERKAGIPVIPIDPCCSKVCKTLNDKIEEKRKLLDTSVSVLGGRRLYESRTYRSLMYGIESLEDQRQTLKENNICRCTEDTGAVSIILPLIQARIEKEELPHIGLRLQVQPPERIREIHREEKSAIPKTNSCCPEACKTLNSEIDDANKTLDDLELRGGPAIYKNPRYEALTYRSSALQEYRSELKKDGCKCVE